LALLEKALAAAMAAAQGGGLGCAAVWKGVPLDRVQLGALPAAALPGPQAQRGWLPGLGERVSAAARLALRLWLRLAGRTFRGLAEQLAALAKALWATVTPLGLHRLGSGPNWDLDSFHREKGPL